MDKIEKIIDLKLKKGDISLEKEKEIVNFSLALLIGVLTFVFTTDLKKYMEPVISPIIQSILKTNAFFALAVILLMIVGIPLIIGSISYFIITLIFKIKNKIYDDRIKEIDKMIKQLQKK